MKKKYEIKQEIMKSNNSQCLLGYEKNKHTVHVV